MNTAEPTQHIVFSLQSSAITIKETLLGHLFIVTSVWPKMTVQSSSPEGTNKPVTEEGAFPGIHSSKDIELIEALRHILNEN